MKAYVLRRVFASSLLFLALAIVFSAFFQANKWGALRQVNPFGEDPYDAIALFAVQAALLVGVLTFARALRSFEQPAQNWRLALILRGNAVVLGTVLFSLVADGIAVLASAPDPSRWGFVLRMELGSMFLLAVAAGMPLLQLSRNLRVPPPPPDLTPADGIDDLLALIRAPVMRFHSHLPDGLVRWVAGLTGERLFSRLPGLDPHAHAWRFAAAAGLAAGAGLFLAQLREGLPPSLPTGLLLALIFIGGEAAMTLLGFALLGGYLRLRPPIQAASSG